MSSNKEHDNSSENNRLERTQQNRDVARLTNESSSTLQKDLSINDRQDHTDHEARVKEIRANRTTPTTAGRVIGDTPELGHKIGDSEVFLSKNQIIAVEHHKLGEVWQPTENGQIQIDRKDPISGEQTQLVLEGKLSVERSGDQITAIKAQIELKDGSTVSYLDGIPTQVSFSNGEIWTNDGGASGDWHTRGADGELVRTSGVQIDLEAGKVLFQNSNIQVDSLIHQSEKSSDRVVTDSDAQQAMNQRALDAAKAIISDPTSFLVSQLPLPRGSSEGSGTGETRTTGHQLIDPETGDITIGKHTYSPDQITAQAAGTVSDASRTTLKKVPQYTYDKDTESCVLLGQRGYIIRKDGSVQKFDSITKKYLGTAVESSGKPFHAKGSFAFQAVNPTGDVEKLQEISLKWVDLYSAESENLQMQRAGETQSAKSSTKDNQTSSSNDSHLQKTPLPSDQSNLESVQKAVELIKRKQTEQGVAEINSHLMQIEFSGATADQKRTAQNRFIQQVLEDANIRMKSISGDFWITSPKSQHMVKLAETSFGDYLAQKPPVDRSRLVQEINTKNASVPYTPGTPLKANVKETDVIAPSRPVEATLQYTEKTVPQELKAAESLEKVEWDRWNYRIQEHLTNTMRPFLAQNMINESGGIRFSFDVSRNGQIYNVAIKTDAHNQSLYTASYNAVMRMRASKLLEFPTNSQLRMQHFDWSLAYGNNIQDGTNFQRGKDEIIRRKY